jgi:hypothetical protein
LDGLGFQEVRMTVQGDMEFRGFKPRQGVEERLRATVATFLEQMPGGGKYQALIADVGEAFVFSLVITCATGIYSSETFQRKKALRGKLRHWQADEMDRILRDVTWQMNRRMTPL